MIIKKPYYFMKVAELTAENSTCVKKKVGAVLVREGKILSTGYNGAPAGIPHCTIRTCLRRLDKDNQHPELCRGCHAEVNTIIQCAIHGTQIGENAVIYCVYFPCMSCTKIIINAKIKAIVFLNNYEMDNLEKMSILEQSTLEVYRFTWLLKENSKYEIELYDVNKQCLKLMEKRTNKSF